MAAAAAPKVQQGLKYKQLIPLMNRVLIRKAEPIKQTQGGIVLPDNTKVKMQRGTVIAVGPGKRTDQGQIIPVTVKPGDEVILADYGGTKMDMENEGTYYLYRDTEILAKLKE